MATGGGGAIHHHQDYYTEVDDIDYHNSAGGFGIQKAGPSTISMVLLFGTIIFATSGLAARTWLLGDTRAIKHAMKAGGGNNTNNHVVRPIEASFLSVYTLMHHLTILSLVLFVVYVLEHHPPFPHGDREHGGHGHDEIILGGGGTTADLGTFDGDYMAMWIIFLCVAAYFTIRRNDGKSSEEVREELKRQEEEKWNSKKGNKKKRGGGSSSVVDNVDMMHNNAGGGDEETSTVISRQSSSSFDPFQGEGMSHGTGNKKSSKYDAYLSQNKQQQQHPPGGGQHTKENEATLIIREWSATPPDNDVLNRHQTNEWKGWMVLLFLLSQYTSATSVGPWHNSQQAFRSAFLWLSGFSHFTYFYTTRDYSLVRVLRMLWRINFLAVLLCLTQGTPYILYYVCPLHSFAFFIVYGTMRIGKSVNYTKFALRVKLLIAAMIVYLLWDVDSGLFRLVHLPLVPVGPPEIGAPLGPMWEWYYQSTLHHWTTFLGIVFAANFPIVSLFLHKLESPLNNGKIVEWLSKGMIGSALGVALYMWTTGPLRYDRYIYNDTHGYFGFIPILAYAYFRNITPMLRQYTVGLFERMGNIALELYLLQYHVLLSSNGKTFLTLLPGYPKCNYILVSFVHYLLAQKIFSLMTFLRGMLLPDDEKTCIKSVGVCCIVIIMFYGAALSLDKMGVVSSPGTIAALIIICGILLYQTILDTTWRRYRQAYAAANVSNNAEQQTGGSVGDVESSSNNNANNAAAMMMMEDENPIAKACPPLIGTAVIVLLGLSWQGLAMAGSTKIGKLPPSCESLVNDGSWTPLDSCSEYNRGIASRQYDVTALGHCDDTLAWAWDANPPGTHCRFSHRSISAVQAALNHRHLIFIGDSMTRNLYHATCRALGDTDPDGSGSGNGGEASSSSPYDATIPQHSDMTRVFGDDTVIEYKWAPLAIDTLTKLKQFRTVKPGRGPDLVVVGGGAWDRLHVWATDEDHDSHKSAITNIATELTKLREERYIPTTWFVPTTINTRALNTEEKRSHMGEKQLEEMRGLYERLGVTDAASFVLDGPSFTRDVVGESYDGVHYPPYVYDAGAQVLANAMDWVLPERDTSDPFDPPSPGAMANPFLGIMMLCFCVIGLFFFDGYLGFSYLGSVFANGTMPSDLYADAFGPLHERYKLPPILSSGVVGAGGGSGMEEEFMGLLGAGGGASPTTAGRGKDMDISDGAYAR